MTLSYNYKTPIKDPHAFVGRRALVSKIYARIGAGRPQSVSIVGDLKTGKSSLLSYLAHEKVKCEMLKNPDDYIFLSIPCRTEKEFTLDTFTGTIYRMTRIYSEDAEKEKIQLEYNYFKRLVEHLHKQNKKIILFLDDFNLITLNSAFPLEFFSFLRSLANNYNLAYITSSYEDLQKLCVSKDIGESPFFNIFTNMSLRGFDSEEIDALLQLNTEETGPNLQPEKLYFTTLVGNSPYLLQMACHYAQKMIAEQVTFNDELKKQLKSILSEKVQAYHQKLWEQMASTNQEILSKVAVGKKIPSGQDYLVYDLNRKNYLISSNGKTQISSHLLKEFILKTTKLTGSEPTSNKQYFRYFWQLKRFFQSITD